MVYDFLIFPKKIQLARCNHIATTAAGGYNHMLREPKRAAPNNGTPSTVSTIYTNVPTLLDAQVETGTQERHNATPHGNVPSSNRTCIFRTSDLLDVGLIDVTTKRIVLQQGDKLVSVHDFTTEEVTELVTDPPGLYVSMAAYIAHGFGDGTANYVQVDFVGRSHGAP